MNEKPNCKTGLKPDIIDKEVFDREIAICQQLSSENKGRCGWGKCADCGVIPLLIKLYKGELLEKPEEIAEAKKIIS